MAYYIKVSKEVADSIGVSRYRNKTADGRYLLWQADLDGEEGNTLLERAAAVDGVCLTANEARDEIDGVGEPHRLPSEMIELIDEKEVKDERKQ